jgi:hypothetical protein
MLVYPTARAALDFEALRLRMKAAAGRRQQRARHWKSMRPQKRTRRWHGRPCTTILTSLLRRKSVKRLLNSIHVTPLLISGTATVWFTWVSSSMVGKRLSVRCNLIRSRSSSTRVMQARFGLTADGTKPSNIASKLWA